MKIEHNPARRGVPLMLTIPAVCAGLLVSGCLASPTYGTGVSANEQLMKDLTSVLAVGGGGGSNRGPEVAYTPRPEIVKPPSLAVLPEPQQDMAATSNPAWPESPEQRRARIRAEATANDGNPHYRSEVTAVGTGRVANVDQGTGLFPNTRRQLRGPDDAANARTLEGTSLDPNQKAEMARIRRDANQGSPTTRKFLSEPPLEYRVPAETAAAGDVGESEFVKARRAKRASGDSSWRDFVPWL